MTSFIKKVSVVFLLTGILSACSIFSPYGTSNIPDPAPLPTYKAKITPQEIWHHEAGVASRGDYLLLTPTISNNVIYTIDINGHFYATSATNGSSLWDKTFENAGKSGVAADANQLAIVDSKGVLRVFSTANGKDLWHATASTQALAAPTFTPNLLLVKTIDGTVTAFDRQNGQQVWQYEHLVPSLMLHASSKVLVQGDRAFVGFSDGKVVALNLKNGEEIWSIQAAEAHGVAEIQRLIDIDADLVLANGKLFVATYQGALVAINPNTGKIVWQQPNSIYANLAADEVNVYAMQADGTITAYDELQGHQRWQQKTYAWRFLSGAIIFNQQLIFGDMEGYVHFLNPTNGEPMGCFLLMKNISIINAPLPCGNNVVCVMDTNGRMAAIR